MTATGKRRAPSRKKNVEETVLLGLGANLGNREFHLLTAWRLLGEVYGIRRLRISQFYETAPVGGPSQPNYLNAAVTIRTSLLPSQLLFVCHQIEGRLLRIRKEHWGPRTIDLDILLFGNRIIRTSELTIPHPLMCERPFVLIPAAEIAPQLRHPLTGQTLAELCGQLAVVPR